jgi:hypothetical protein
MSDPIPPPASAKASGGQAITYPVPLFDSRSHNSQSIGYYDSAK